MIGCNRKSTTFLCAFCFLALFGLSAGERNSECEPVSGGVASWYGGRFQGRTTASGETFDTNELTAAHRTLPFDTIVRVTNTENGSHVEVRINDRGPFVQGRVIDLSRAAAAELDMIEAGVAEVSLCIVAGPGGDSAVTLQAASFSERENARRMRDRLTDAGYVAVIREHEGLHRLLVENVAAHRVERAREELTELGFPGAFVRR